MIEKDSTNSEFLIKLRDIIEPLKDLLPKEYGSLKGPSLSDGQNRLRMLMENSRMTPGNFANIIVSLSLRTSVGGILLKCCLFEC